EIGQAYPVVHRWPERPIGETIVVLLTIKRRQVHQRVLNPPFIDHSGLGCRLGSYLAAPTEPETLIGLKCFSQCNGQPPAVPLPAALGTDTRLETTTSRGKEALQDGASRTTYCGRGGPANRPRAHQPGFELLKEISRLCPS